MALRPLMTDSELKHRKRLQSKVSVVGSTLGLTALGAKGVGSAAPKIARLGSRGAGIKQRADKVTEAGLIGSAGVGGLGGYNFAAIQNAEARKRPRQTVRKEASAMLDFGLGPVKQGSAAREAEVFKTEEIAKLGPPKARVQEIVNLNRDAPTDTVDAHYKGKSAILRRPKYQAVAYSSKSKHGDVHTVTPNYRMKRSAAKLTHETYQGKKRKIDYGNGSANFVRKAYDPEANRQKNMNRAATAFAAGSGALAAGAALTGKKAYKPLKAMAGTKRGSAALKNGGKTAVLGAGSFGAAVTSDRILGHKNGRGGRYRPLRERGF